MWKEQDPRIKYCCWAMEVGASGTPHIQGYVQLKESHTMSALKRWGKRFERAHLEPAKGTPAQNKDYCSKECTEENPLQEWGDIPDPSPIGSEGDQKLREMCAALRDGKPMTEVAEISATTFVRNFKGLERYSNLQPLKRLGWSKIFWCWGPTGTGKSRWAKSYEGYSHEQIFIKEPDPWWDGYVPQQHKVVIFDDFRAWPRCFHPLLRWTDRGPCTVQVKGGTLPLCPEAIIFTTPFCIEAAFAEAAVGEDLQQLHRRIRESGGKVLSFPLAPAAVPEAFPEALPRIALEMHAASAQSAAQAAAAYRVANLEANAREMRQLQADRLQRIAREAQIARNLERENAPAPSVSNCPPSSRPETAPGSFASPSPRRAGAEGSALASVPPHQPHLVEHPLYQELMAAGSEVRRLRRALQSPSLIPSQRGNFDDGESVRARRTMIWRKLRRLAVTQAYCERTLGLRYDAACPPDTSDESGTDVCTDVVLEEHAARAADNRARAKERRRRLQGMGFFVDDEADVEECGAEGRGH